MSVIGRIMQVGIAGLLALALVACTTIYRNHGWAPSDEDLAAIEVGKSTRDDVSQAVGAPGTSGLLADSGWYYVESRFETFAYREPKEVDRQVVAISFRPDGVVSNVERFGLERGQVVRLSRRVTEDNTQGIPFLRQLFGSIGRVNAEQLFGGSG